MTISKKTKTFFYEISTLVLKWSLVYLLVLFFLEDTRPFMVSTVFSPHWILVVLVLGLVGVLWTAPYGHIKKDDGTIGIVIKKYDIWIARVLSVILFLLLLTNYGSGFFRAICFAGVVYASYRILLILMEEYY